MREEKYYPSNTPNRQASMRASNPVLLCSDRTAIESERTVEASKLSTTSWSHERYPNGVALTIPAKGTLTLPTRRGSRCCQVLVRARPARQSIDHRKSGATVKRPDPRQPRSPAAGRGGRRARGYPF
jgi:hypothetical protein